MKIKEKIITLFLILGMVVITGCEKQKKEEEKQEINYETIASDIMNKYYKNIFNFHSNLYCGEVDSDDTLDTNIVRIKKYNSISEINSNLKTFLSDEFIKENLSNNFIEKDGKLYCKQKGTSGLEYNQDSLKINIIKREDEKIVLQTKYKTLENDLYAAIEYEGTATIINQNNNWLLDTYEEK